MVYEIRLDVDSGWAVLSGYLIPRPWQPHQNRPVIGARKIAHSQNQVPDRTTQKRALPLKRKDRGERKLEKQTFVSSYEGLQTSSEEDGFDPQWEQVAIQR